MKNFFETWQTNEQYFYALQALASLSGLFSDAYVPYLDYRLAENVFCKFFNATNEARSCTAYDARLQDLGVGIKTFILKNNQSSEKIAEFNKLKPELDALSDIALARKLGEFRNDRISIADNIYGTSRRVYHIIGRLDNKLRIFNVEYEKVNVDGIKLLKDDGKHFSFTDGVHEYFFNRSKSVLLRRFNVPSKGVVDVPVKILNDSLVKILNFFSAERGSRLKAVRLPESDVLMPQGSMQRGFDYAILPLYSDRGGIRSVPQKSGLNQWNAGGRARDENEVYIPIPKMIHMKYPRFFPPRDEHFVLKLPDGQKLSAKVCQDNSKALMSTHNADLGKWILRKVLRKPPGELITMEDLNRYGIDSVRILNEHKRDGEGRQIYGISFTSDAYESYDAFIAAD